ncbi:unnamed protein product [Arabis nemorensis]|uniref:Uncharacterized protein n=1 Tax=Arabis nemorensis TaxID=586526 RepID=A0A565BYA9_9BRAS|nr:unnamed protein product [Arabis nemorensis]
MDSSTLPILSQASESAERNGSSDPETMKQMVVLERDKIQELKKTVPGMWRLPTNPDLCCIYRVPNCIREVNPKAYTPQLAVIGPLHHCLKSQAPKALGDVANTKSMGYINVEEHKKTYLAAFAQRVQGRKTIDEFRRIIEEDEAIIRASYSESTAWIKSPEFVEMILHDSVFIIEIMLRYSIIGPQRTGDPLMDEPCLENTVKRDLMLLENQLPYFILEKLFDPIVPLLRRDETLRTLVISHFGLRKSNLKNNTKFRHFTDLYRSVRVDKFQKYDREVNYTFHMHNADKLYSKGVNFEVVKEEEEFFEEFSSVEVKFEHGCLKIPCFLADDEVEITLRNIMALEQCHYPFNAYVCSYVVFLDFLVDNDKDVDLLVEKGIIKHWNGHQGLVTKMINKLCVGVVDHGSYYSDLVKSVNDRYKHPFYNSFGVLRRVYFSNMWKGTATIAAICILLLTLTQTVTSLIELLQKKKK